MIAAGALEPEKVGAFSAQRFRARMSVERITRR